MCGGKNPPSHLLASGFFFDAGPGFLTMTTPEAVEEDMLTAVRADAALNKDKASSTASGVVIVRKPGPASKKNPDANR